MSGKSINSHVLVLTDENGLIYSKYSSRVSHLEVFRDFQALDITVKDCFIEEHRGFDLAKILLKAVSSWVFKTYGENLDVTSVSIKKYQKKSQFVIMGISGRTDAGTVFYVAPSELIDAKKNFFSDIY